MMEKVVRLFSREFKLAALARMEAGENVSALTHELGVKRKCLYPWRDRFRSGGPLALRARGRPRKAEVLAIQYQRRLNWRGPVGQLYVRHRRQSLPTGRQQQLRHRGPHLPDVDFGSLQQSAQPQPIL
jgi:transposase-like protein